MESKLKKKSILQKTAQVGFSSLISKFLGIMREILQVHYLGIGPISDAFNMAYKIPNSLRKVFAEGALSAAFIPTLVKVVKEEKENQASKLMTLMIMVVSSVVLFLCLLVFLFPDFIIWLYAPGFIQKAQELTIAISLVKVLIFFIFFISFSALLAGAMQAKNHFWVPSWGSVLLNIMYISGLLICNHYGLSVEIFCFFLLGGGLLQLLVYIYKYLDLKFIFAWPDSESFNYLKQVMIKFIPCFFAMSAMEINLLIDARFASALPSGSLTLINISSRFMGIALSVFATAFSSILLSHFSRITTYAPKRLSYYLLESSKFIFWVTIPAILLMSFFSHDLFYTTFYKFSSNKFTVDMVGEATQLLIAFLMGLFFFSLNRLLLSVYYSLHDTFLPTVISFVATIFNIILNRILMPYYGSLGLAIATSLAAGIQTIIFIYMLHRKFKLNIYLNKFFEFVLKFIPQLIGVFTLFYVIYNLFIFIISNYLNKYENFLIKSIGLWIWAGPLSLCVFYLLYELRKKFKLKIYFLD